MPNIGSLSVYLTAKTEKFNNSMARAKLSVKSFGQQIKGVSIATVASIGAMGYAVNRLAGKLDDIGKASKRMGVTAEAFQKLTFSATRSGATANDVEKAFKRMASVILDAENGLTENVRALEALGLSFKELKGLAPEKQFDIVAKRLAMIEDHSLKSALAQDLFGRSGTMLLPMIKNYKELAKELENVNGIINNETVKAGEKLKDDMEDLNRSLTAVVANSGFVKWLADVSGGLNDILKSTSKLDTFARSFIESQAGMDANIFSIADMWLKGGAKALKQAGFGTQSTETKAITKAQVKAKIEAEKRLQSEKTLVNTLAKQNADAKQKLKDDKEIAKGLMGDMQALGKVFFSTNKMVEKAKLKADLIALKDKKKTQPVVAQARFAGAVEKGTVEAYQAEIGIKNTDKQIERNTGESLKVQRQLLAESKKQQPQLQVATIGV